MTFFESFELNINAFLLLAPTYRALQQKFLESVEGIDSNNIVKIINMHPYHIDVRLEFFQGDIVTMTKSILGAYSAVGALQDVRR